jgi:hypothetical protein
MASRISRRNIVEFFGQHRARLRSRNEIAIVSGLSDADPGRVRAMYLALR